MLDADAVTVGIGRDDGKVDAADADSALHGVSVTDHGGRTAKVGITPGKGFHRHFGANDLTGALDPAVGFAGGGRRVVVARRPDRIAAALVCDPDVIAVNTASREGTETHALEAMEEVATMLPVAEMPVLVKKIDSRLKGRVRAETADAILERLGTGCLDVVAEIAPGLPVSDVAMPWGRMWVVTKSGGFGPPDLLRRIPAGARDSEGIEA